MAYDEIRSLVEQHGGKMDFERKGYTHGAWVIRIGGRTRIFESEGDNSNPGLDRLYVPKVPNPKTWNDYSTELVPDAEDKLLRLLRLERFP